MYTIMWLKKGFSQITINQFYSILSGLLTLAGVWFLLYNIWSYPNLYAIDFWWQIASAELFISHGLHGRSLQRFQWIINNLFYPPAQDFLVATIHWITSLDTLFSFLVYVSVLLVVYFGVTWLISLQFKYIGSKILYFICAIIFFTLDKFPDIWYVQWLWVVDILFTWLISQILWAVFLQLTIYEILTKKRIFLMSIYSILWFLSHLVVWPVTILLVTIFIAYYNRKQIIPYILSVIWLTAFFWVPFIWYKWQMASTNIFNPVPYLVTIILICWLLLWCKNKNILLFSVVWTLILLPSYIYYLGQFFSINIPLPNFHYYRFISIACIIWLPVLGLLSDTILWSGYMKNKRNNSIVQVSLYSALSIFILLVSYTKRWDFWIPMNKVLWKPVIPSQQDLQNLSWLSLNHRIFTIDRERPVDFAIDALDQYLWYQNSYVKWLFWESNYNNQLVSSYITNLLSPFNSVLYNHYLGSISYSTYENIRNKFIENYGIWYILIAPVREIYYISPSKYSYLLRFLGQWTNDISTQKTGTVLLNNKIYTLYKLIPRENSKLQNTIVSIINTPPISLSINKKEPFFTESIMKSYITSPINNSIYRPDIIYNQDDIPVDFTYTSWTANIQKITSNLYEITTTSTWKTWIQVKINQLPWVKFYDEDQKIIPTISLPFWRYFTVQWGQKVSMTYSRTLVMYIWYIISIVSLLYMLYNRLYLFWKKKDL